MNNVENKNSPKMIIGFVFGLFAGVIGVLFAQYVVGGDEPEKNSILDIRTSLHSSFSCSHSSIIFFETSSGLVLIIIR